MFFVNIKTFYLEIRVSSRIAVNAYINRSPRVNIILSFHFKE